MTLADATVTSMKKWKRKPADFYATPYAATVAVIPMLELEPGALVGDPACGDGAISRVLISRGFEVVSADLRHTGYGLGGYDYLTGSQDGSLGELAESPVEGSMGWLAEYGLLDALVTNPPFSLAEQFIRKAVQQAPVVAMLLKSNYWNAGGRLKLWDDCTPTGHHPMTWRLAFLEEERGKSPLMDCDWWIWDRRKPPLGCRPLARPVFDEAEIPVAGLVVHMAAAVEAAERVSAALKNCEELL